MFAVLVGTIVQMLCFSNIIVFNSEVILNTESMHRPTSCHNQHHFSDFIKIVFFQASRCMWQSTRPAWNAQASHKITAVSTTIKHSRVLPFLQSLLWPSEEWNASRDIRKSEVCRIYVHGRCCRPHAPFRHEFTADTLTLSFTTVEVSVTSFGRMAAECCFKGDASMKQARQRQSASLSRCHRCDRNVSSGVSERRFMCFKFVIGFRPTSSLKRSTLLIIISLSKTLKPLSLESAIQYNLYSRYWQLHTWRRRSKFKTISRQ